MKIISYNAYKWTGIWPYRARPAFVFRIPWLWWLDWKRLQFLNWYRFEFMAKSAQIKFWQAGGVAMNDERWGRFLDDDLTSSEFLAMIMCMGERQEGD